MVTIFILLLAVVGLTVVCVAKTKEAEETRMQLDERTRQLEVVLLSVVRTRGKSARRMAKRYQPFREILRKVPGVDGEERKH